MKKFAFLLVVGAAIGVLVAYNINLSANPPSNTPISPMNSPDLVATAQADTKTDDQAGERLPIHTQTRPLFSPSRRPWVAPVVQLVSEPVLAEPMPSEPVVPVQVAPPQVTLLGIQKTPKEAKALLLKATTSDAVWLSNGEKLDEWTVGKIDNATVELTYEEQSITLELYPAVEPAGDKP